jgi:hypothetical protein
MHHTVTEPVDYMKAAKIIGNHYNNKSNFLHYILNAKYADDKQTQNVTAEIKIKKDEQILVSIRFLVHYGKSIDNSNSVSYYEKKKELTLKEILAH